MELWRRFLLSGMVLRQADAGTGAGDGGDAGAGDPAALAEAAAAVQGDGDAGGGTPAAPPKPQSRMVPLDSMLPRIDREQKRAQDAEERAQAAERRAQDAEALAARLQQPGADGKPAATPAPARAAPDQQTEFKAAVAQEAARQRLFDDSMSVKTAGLTQFGAAFEDTLRILGAVGATSDDFVSDVLAVDKANAHVLLDKLAKDPERAVALATMDSRRRTAELTRMSMSETAKPAAAAAADTKAAAAAADPQAGKTKVSAAPAPRPAMDATSRPGDDWQSDDASDESFSAGWNSKYMGRKAG